MTAAVTLCRNPVCPADCCDGTDEPKGSCKNTCLQASASHKQELQQQIDTFAQALEKKAQFIQQAHEKLENWKLRQQVIDAEIDDQKSAVEQLRGEQHASTPMHA